LRRRHRCRGIHLRDNLVITIKFDYVEAQLRIRRNTLWEKQ
jgi:hypothetical protein